MYNSTVNFASYSKIFILHVVQFFLFVLKGTKLKVLNLFLKETSLKRTTKGKFALRLGIRNNCSTCHYIDIFEVWVFGDISFQWIEMIDQIFI